MTGLKIRKRHRDRLPLDAGRQQQPDRLIPGHTLGHRQREKPLLDRRRIYRGWRRRIGAFGQQRARDLGLLAYGLIAQGIVGTEPPACPGCAHRDLHGADGIAAEFVETIVDADLREAEQFLPYLAKHTFGRILRRRRRQNGMVAGRQR
jgi:hypothetical protein